MFFTIKPMVNLGRPETKVLADDWTAVTRDKSLSAQFEHSIGVTATGCEIFTLSPGGGSSFIPEAALVAAWEPPAGIFLDRKCGRGGGAGCGFGSLRLGYFCQTESGGAVCPPPFDFREEFRRAASPP